MLNKIIVNLKNIIFFKLVLYATFTIILFILIPTFTNDLTNASQKKQKAYTYLESATIKLESIVDFEIKVTEINNSYQKLKDRPKETECSERNKLVNNIKLLSTKYQLFEPINIRVIKAYNINKAPNTNGHVQLNYYNVALKFKTSNYSTLLLLFNDIIYLLPKGAVVEKIEINKMDILTPEIISNLTSSGDPDIIDVKMNIKLREIVYE